MKNIFAVLLLSSPLLAEGPIFKHQDRYVNQEFQNAYNDIRGVISRDVRITNWTSWTPTFTNFGTVTGISAWWRRVGDTIEVRGTAVAGTTTGSVGKMSLPNSYTIDTSKAGSQAVFGYFIGGSSGGVWWSGNFATVPFYDGADNTVVFFAKSNSGVSLVKQNTNNFAVASEIMVWQFAFPATGLSF